MTQKRVDDGPRMNDRQQIPAEGLRGRLLAEARKMLSFGLIGVVNGVVNYMITVGLTLFALTPLGLATHDGTRVGVDGHHGVAQRLVLSV